MHAQFIKNIPSMYHAKALVPFSPIFKMAICHLNFIYSQLLGNRSQFLKVFIFFTMYPLFIVGKKPGGQMTVLYLLTKYLQTFYFFLFLMSSPTKNVLQLFTTLQIAFDISLATQSISIVCIGVFPITHFDSNNNCCSYNKLHNYIIKQRKA